MLVWQFRQVFHHILFLLAKSLHAELPNVVGGGVAVNLMKSVVQVHKVPSQLVRQQFPCCGLAGTHVADEIDWKFHKFSGLQQVGNHLLILIYSFLISLLLVVFLPAYSAVGHDEGLGEGVVSGGSNGVE